MATNGTKEEKPYNLAIIGGGIAGCVLSIGLTARGIQHTLYESASQFGEIGAGVGFDPHMVRTMGLIAPEVQQAFVTCCNEATLNSRDDEKPVWFSIRVGDERRGDGDRVVRKRIVEGEEKELKVGDTLFQVPWRPGPRGGVHRAHFLDELVKHIPPSIPQFRKRLVDISPAPGGSSSSLLTFADGTTAQHTAVLGCDGIKSRCREIVLGKEEARPLFSGKYAYRGLIPMEQALQLEGVLDESRYESQMYMGYHGHVLTFPIAKGKILNVVAFSSRPTWTDPNWVITNSRAEMLADYSSWSPTVRAIIGAMQKPDIWALFHHPSTSTFYSPSLSQFFTPDSKNGEEEEEEEKGQERVGDTRPKICLVGDAAHATTPHQGSGAGMCIEDVYILSELLSSCTSTSSFTSSPSTSPSSSALIKAFSAYDSVRRPRTLKLVKTSKEGAELYEFESEHGDDLMEIERKMLVRMDWIWDYDDGLAEDLRRARGMLGLGDCMTKGRGRV